MAALMRQAYEATQIINTIASTRGVGPQDKLVALGQVQRQLEGQMRKLMDDRDASRASGVATSTGD